MEHTINIVGHLVNTKTNEWYHLDDRYNLWTCDCMETLDENKKVSLCLSQCTHLQDEGEERELKRSIAQKRKELGYLQNQKIEIDEQQDK